MKKVCFPKMISKLKSRMAKYNSQKKMQELLISLVELISTTYTLKNRIEENMSIITDKEIKAELNDVKNELELYTEKLMKLTSKLVGRNMVIHTVNRKQTLWEVVSKYNSDIAELFELNDIKDIFSFSEKKVILIPLLDQAG